MNDQQRAAMQMALEWMGWYETDTNQPEPHKSENVYAVLREALVQPQGEPVAWMDAEGDVYKMPVVDKWLPPHQMLYTTPPSVEAAIEATKEKAAKVCDGFERKKWEILAKGGVAAGLSPADCAAAIRSMK